jgi:hypothetical protein
VKPQVKYRTKKSKGIEKKKMTGENAGEGIKARCEVLTEGGEVEKGDDLRVVGEVDDDSGVRRRGEFLGVVDEDDLGTSHDSAVVDGPESGAAMHFERLDQIVAVKQAISEVFPKVRRTNGESVWGPGTLAGFYLAQFTVRVRKFDGDGEAEAVAVFAVVLGGILRTVAGGALPGKLDGFGKRSEKLDCGDPGAGFGDRQMAAVLVKELGGFFVAALPEEIGFANGLVG